MKALRMAVLLGALTIIYCSFAGQVLAEEISVVGTGSGAIIVEKLGAAFSEANPGVTVSVPPSIGSGGGIKAVGMDQAPIGRTARGIKDKEKEFGLTYTPVLKLPIVFFTNKNVGIQTLSTQQICDIYSGKITNWKEVGGQDAPIRVIRREDGDSSLDVLLKVFPGFKDITITAKSKTTLSDPETCEMVLAKENTIAFGPYANVTGLDVAVITIDNRDPTDPSYPYVASLGLVYKEKNKTGNIGKFIEFSTSPAAQEIIQKAGGLSL